ncbi:MAG: ATP-grasp domain-containing protein [Muribaculum sp.]|nr:ATP-grasp domain-containing protein [Muribaculum sp.]
MKEIRKVIVLAGGNDQIELIRGLRNRFPNVEVLLVDMNPNVVAKDYADKMLVISTMDFDAVLAASKAENIDLIISACGDNVLRTMAFVSEKLNLPCYLTFEQSLNLTNKVMMKDKMIAGGIPTSKYRKFDISHDIDISGLKFPLVIKPSDNNGSKGIIKTYNTNDFEAAIAEAKKFTISGDLIVEEFKQGEEYSIEAFIQKDGTPTIVFASKNIKIKNRNTFTICCNRYVNNLQPEIKEKLIDIIKSISRTFGIANVPLLLQCIVNQNEVNVIEFSARTGGGSKLFFIREMSNIDIIDNLIDITVGCTPIIEPKHSKNEAIINYIYSDKGIFSGIEGVDDLISDGIISSVFLYKQFGTEIKSSNYSSDRPAGVLIEACDESSLKAKIKEANRRLKILDENGHDIMRHDIFESSI